MMGSSIFSMIFTLNSAWLFMALLATLSNPQVHQCAVRVLVSVLYFHTYYNEPLMQHCHHVHRIPVGIRVKSEGRSIVRMIKSI
ncbi:hypothetical protein K439DRAFT_403691 [Ramaria rubella]|nr:hypothetical protein K439DRAFT_403691 [Ramaria rubella]